MQNLESVAQEWSYCPRYERGHLGKLQKHPEGGAQIFFLGGDSKDNHILSNLITPDSLAYSAVHLM